MTLNAHYIVLFKNPSDVSQFANLARQMYPKTSQFAVEAGTVQLSVSRPSTRAGRRVATENKYFSRRDSLRIRSKGMKRRCIRRQIQCMLQYRTEMCLRVKKFLSVLRRIRKMGDKARRDYVKKCNREFIDCVSECSKNVIKGNVPMTGPQQTCVKKKGRQSSVDQQDVVDKEASNPAKGRFSDRSSAFGVVDSE